MTTHEHRLQFHQLLTELGLPAETADAILATMAPFPWHELATKADLANFATKTDLANFATKTDLADLRATSPTRTEMNDGFAQLRGEMNDGFGQLRSEMADLRSDVRVMVVALIGFMLSIVLTAAGAGIGLLVT